MQVCPSQIENTGADVFVGFTLNDTMVTARLPGNIATNLGSTLSLAFAQESLSLFDADTGIRLHSTAPSA